MSKGAATMGRSLRWFVVACAVMGVLSAVGMSTAWGAPLPRENESVAPWFLPLQENVDGVPAPGLVHSTVADASAILAASPTAYLASTSKGRVDDGEDGFINATATGASNPGNGLGGTYSPIYRWLAKTTSGAGAMIANLQPGDTLVMAAVVANVSSASVARLQAGTLSSTEYAGLLQGVTADFYTPYNTAVAGAYQVFSPTYTEINPSSATGVTKDVKDATLVVFLWDGSAQGTALNAVNPALLVVPATATTTGTGADTNGLRAVVQLVGGRTVNSNYVGFDLNGPVFEDAMIVGAVGPDGKSVGMIDRRLKQTGYTVIPTNAVSEIRSGDTLIVDATFVVHSEWDGEPDAYFGANTDELVDAYSTYIPNIGDPDGNLAASFLRQENDIDVKAMSTTLPAAAPVDKPGDFLVTGLGTPVTTPPIANGEPGVWLGFRDGGGLSQEYLNTNWIATGTAGKIVMRATFVVTDASTVAYANGALTVDGGPDTGHNALPIHFVVGDELGLHHANQYALGVGAGQAALKFNAAAIGNISNATVGQVTGYVDTRPPVIVRAVLTSNEHRFAKGPQISGGSWSNLDKRGIIGATGTVGLQVNFTLEEDLRGPLGTYYQNAFTMDYEATALNNVAAPIILQNSQDTNIWDLATSQQIFGVSAATSFAFAGVATDMNAGVIVRVTDDARNMFTFTSTAPQDAQANPWKAGGIAGTPKASTLAVDLGNPAIRAATMYVTQNIIGTQPIGNGEVMTLLKDAAVGSDAKSANGVVLGATIGSEDSKIRIQVDFDPDVSDANNAAYFVEKALSSYPNNSAYSSLYTLFNYSPSSPNWLGVNTSGGLFDVRVDIPQLRMTPSSFTVISSATTDMTNADYVSVTLEGTIPAFTSWLAASQAVGSVTGLAYVTATVEVYDSVYDSDYADHTGATNGQLVAAAMQAFATGIMVDSKPPLVFNQATNTANIAGSSEQAPYVGLIFAATTGLNITANSFNNTYGLNLGPYPNGGDYSLSLSARPEGESELTEVKAGDWLIVEATMTTNEPTLIGGGPAVPAVNWPSTPSALDNVPALISAAFTDFISTATAVRPVAGQALQANGTPYTPVHGVTEAVAGDIVLVTFAQQITGSNLATLSPSTVRSVTVNVFDVAGNKSAATIYGATADFGSPQITITGFDLNGVAVSSLTNATVSVGDRLDVYATVLATSGSTVIDEIWADFRDFGLIMFRQDQASTAGPVYDATVSYINPAGAYTMTSLAALAGSGITAGSPISVTFTYNALVDNNTALSGRTAKVVISATNTGLVGSQQNTPLTGVDLNAPTIVYKNLAQSGTPISPGDTLTDDIVRPGDQMTFWVRIQADAADQQGVATTGTAQADQVTITPWADLSNFGASLGTTVAPTYRHWDAGVQIYTATWVFTVGTPSTEGLLGPYGVSGDCKDAVDNSEAAQTTGSFKIENGPPNFAVADIVVGVSNDRNLVSGVTLPVSGTAHGIYVLPGVSGSGYTRSGSETVKAGDAVYVTATIALNDDPSKVQVNNSGLTLTAPSLVSPAPTPSWRIGTTNIQARWDILVPSTAPSLIPSGAYATEQQFVVKAQDTANLSRTIIEDSTLEIDNTPPNATLTARVFVKNNAANASRRGANLTNEAVITGQDGAAVLVGPATFEAELVVTYDGNPSGADRNDFPGRALANWGVLDDWEAMMAQLGLTDLTGGAIPEPDFYFITGAGPYVTSASSTAQIAASTNTTVTYYYYNLPGVLTDVQVAALAANPALLPAVPRNGFNVAAAAGNSKAVASLIGYASDDIGNVTPTTTIIQSAGANDYTSIISMELDNKAPSFTAYNSQYGAVKYATFTVSQTDNVAFNPFLPRVSSGDVVQVVFGAKDDTNNTTPLTASFNLGQFYLAGDTPTATLVSVDNSPSAVGAFGSGAANKFIYTISNIVPSAAGTAAVGTFTFVVGGQTTNPVNTLTAAWTDANMPGAEILIDATDAINLNNFIHTQAQAAYLKSATLEVDNQAPAFVAKSLVKPDGTVLSKELTSDKVDTNADVHVAARMPGDTVWQILDPPSITNIGQDPANPTLIRATATVFSDSLPSFTTDLLTKFNGDGNTRLQNLITSITNNGNRKFTLNATAEIVANAKPIQPQVVKFTALDNQGNAGTSADANVLGINAQGVFLLEDILYVNGVDVDDAGGGAAQTGTSAPDRLLAGAGIDELRPGDEIKYVATFGNDSGAPDVLTADFSAFYPPILKPFVTYLVPSATQAGAGNTTIATWEYATVQTMYDKEATDSSGVHFASIWINDTTTFGRYDKNSAADTAFAGGINNPGQYPPGRQGFGVSLDTGAVQIAPMGAAQAPVALGQAVIGNGKIAVQNVWNLSDARVLANTPAQATGTQAAKAAKVIVTATDYSSLFPASQIQSDGLIVDTQPPEVKVTLTPGTPAAFRTAGDGHVFNRVTRGDTVTVAADIINPNVLLTGDDNWLAGPGSNLNNVVVAADVSGFGGSSALAFPITGTYTEGGLTHFQSTQTVTVGSGVGITDTAQQTPVDITWIGQDDVSNNIVEVIHEQPVAVDNFPPSIFRGSLGVELRSGTATYGEGASQIVYTTPGSKLGRTGWRIAPGSVLRVSAVIGDSLDDPLGFLSNNRISLTLSGSPTPPSATVTLQNDLATISQTNLSAPFDVELARGMDLDTTLGFGFTVSVTDIVGNNATETNIGSFDVNGRPTLKAYATTTPARLTNQAVSAGETLAINADEILTLDVVTTDLGTVVDMDVTQTPAGALGSTFVWQTNLSGGSTGTAVVTITPDVPTFGVGPIEPFAVEANATDDDGLTTFITPGINIAINDIPLFSPVFPATFDGTTEDLTSDDIGRLSVAGADVRQVTIEEGEILTVTIEARDMSAVPANLTLVATGTAISSDVTIANATLNGVNVLNAATDPAAAFVESGSIEFIFEPGFEAVPFVAGAEKGTFTLRVYVADEAQVALGTQKDYVDILIDVLPEAAAPDVEVLDVTILNADGTLMSSLGAVAAADVQETSTAVITAGALDPGGEPVTLTFDIGDSGLPTVIESPKNFAQGSYPENSWGNDPSIVFAEITLTPGLFDADAGVGEGYVDSADDPTTVTVTGTNSSGLSASDNVVLDILNHPMPPILTVATSQGGADIGAGVTINIADTTSVKFYITAQDSDAELVIVDVDGHTLDNSVTVAGQSTGTYTFEVPIGVIANTTYNLVVRGIDGGFQITRRTVAVTVLVGNQAPTLVLNPTTANVQPEAQTTIVATATDLDGDALAFGATVAPEGIGTVAVGTVTKDGNVSTVNIVFTAGADPGTATITVTATDPSTSSDTETATITILSPAQEPDEMILAQGHGGITQVKRNFMNESDQWRFSPFSGFQALTPSFATQIVSPRDRFTNVAVADFNQDGKLDILTGFGPGGMAANQPSIILIWEQYTDKTPTVISTRGAFAKTATNVAYQNLQGQINVAAGDFIGEGTPLIVAAQGVGGANQIRVFQLSNLRVVGGVNKGTMVEQGTFRAWPGAGTPALWGNTSGGVTVAAGDLDGDGIDELVVGQMNGAQVGDYKPETYFQVLKLARSGGTVVVDKYSTAIHAFDDAGQYGLGGVNLAIGDVNGDGKNDIVVASAGNPDATVKNLVRAFDLAFVAGGDAIIVEPIMPARSLLAAASNPSGALSIAVGNLDRVRGDEILVGTQAILSTDLGTGVVTASSVPPAILARGLKLNFVDGAYTSFGEVRTTFAPFGGTAVPTSQSVFVGFYPIE